jgi:serine/threonine protein phosphatase PrpC
MAGRLRITLGQYSAAGAKEVNQDFHGAIIPDGAALTTKGIAVAMADGISSSGVSGVASESAVKSFLTDYYCTSEAWSVKTSAYRVLAAANSWLHAQTRRGGYGYDRDRGYVCTFSGLILKSATAHFFHVGDSRMWRVTGATLEQLTSDHRLAVSAEQSYLSRALGMENDVEVDYRSLPVSRGDTFLLTTDGVHEHVPPRAMVGCIAAAAGDLDAAARQIAAQALANGSMDNLTVQIVRIDDVPADAALEVVSRLDGARLPSIPEPRQVFDGYRIERQLHGTSRSHIFLATDIETDALVVLKLPSIDLRDDEAYLRRFMMEEWIARRIDSPHVLKAGAVERQRAFLYTVSEWVDGQTLAQWMLDHPKPDLSTVRGFVEQIGAGLRAFHRREMVHQDLRPANIMIDRTGTVKIIDFGSTRVAGIAEASPQPASAEVLGTQQYTAPECFLGEAGSPRADLYSLAAIAYHMLSGRLPYGTQVAAARTRAEQRRLHYRSVLDESRDIPAWVDAALEQALSIDPSRRHVEVSDFIEDLRRPNPRHSGDRPRALLDRAPNRVWKSVALVMGLAAVVQLLLHLAGRW